MAPVFPQMHRHAIGAGVGGQQARFGRIRVERAPRLADGGDVINIHAETNRRVTHGDTGNAEDALGTGGAS